MWALSLPSIALCLADVGGLTFYLSLLSLYFISFSGTRQRGGFYRSLLGVPRGALPFSALSVLLIFNNNNNNNNSTTLIFMYCWTKEYTSIQFCHDEIFLFSL